MSRSSAPTSRASSAMWGISVSSAFPFSRATRIFLYMVRWTASLAAGQTDEIEEKFDVEYDDDRRGEPGKDLDPGGIGKLAHLGLLARKHHERDDRKGQLEAEHHLAQDEEF